MNIFYNSLDKIGNNKKIICFFVFIAGIIILLDALAGFQGMTVPASDIWHHRAVLIALADNPINPANPHILSNEGSRTFIPL